MQFSSHKIYQKIKLLKKLFFFKIFRTLNEHLPCLAEKFWAGLSKLKIVLYVFRVSFWGEKEIFESLVSFHLFRTWNVIVLDLRQQSFHPVCQKCNLRVYMNSLRGVDIRSDITWRETFFEPWRKNVDLFLKTAFYVSKGTFWVKKTLFESSVFFQTLRNFERTFTVLGEKVFGRDIKIEKCSFRRIRFIKKSNFWKSSFFSNFQNFEGTFTVLGEKRFGRDIRNENCTLCLQSINLRIKIVFWKFCKLSLVSDLEHEVFGFVATEFSPGLSKMQSTCLYEFSSRCWY